MILYDKFFIVDDVYLLPFLRGRKYSMDRVFEAFEKALLFIHAHPNWFDWTGDNLKRALDLHNCGYIKVMNERDSEGRRIVLINNRFDLKKYTVDDVFRINCLIIMMLSFEEETQICGVNYIDDCSNITMKYLSIYPLKSLFEFTSQLKFIPMRVKTICLIGLPSFAMQFINIIKLALSDTMKKRLQVPSNIDECGSYIDRTKLTKKYGGKFDDSEVIKYFNEIVEKNLKMARKFVDFEIDEKKAGLMKDIHESFGSFRKLEID